jgi:hypothetical protein
VVSVSVFVPETWVETGIVPGEFAILRSYPESKHVGGEALEQGDTKCDLSIRPSGTTAADLIQQWRSDPNTRIVSQVEVVLHSGQLGTRMELKNLGARYQ